MNEGGVRGGCPRWDDKERRGLGEQEIMGEQGRTERDEEEGEESEAPADDRTCR